MHDPLRQIEQQIINSICPNPDTMTYEQLLELEEKVGSVNKGFSKEDIQKLPSFKYTKSYKSDKNDDK